MKLGMGHEAVRKDKASGKVIPFDRKSANLRVPLVTLSYLDKERLKTDELMETT